MDKIKAQAPIEEFMTKHENREIPMELLTPRFKAFWEIVAEKKLSFGEDFCNATEVTDKNDFLLKYIQIFLDDIMSEELMKKMASYGKAEIIMWYKKLDDPDELRRFLVNGGGRLLMLRNSNFAVNFCSINDEEVAVSVFEI